jgi:hypothetical protein
MHEYCTIIGNETPPPPLLSKCCHASPYCPQPSAHAGTQRPFSPLAGLAATSGFPGIDLAATETDEGSVSRYSGAELFLASKSAHVRTAPSFGWPRRIFLFLFPAFHI